MHRMFRLRQPLLLQLREFLRLSEPLWLPGKLRVQRLRLPEPLRLPGKLRARRLRLPELLQLREYLRLHAGARAGT